MMTIREYLAEILEVEGFDAWYDEDQMLWEAYEDDDDSVFEGLCEDLGIAIDYEEIQAWAWDHDE